MDWEERRTSAATEDPGAPEASGRPASDAVGSFAPPAARARSGWQRALAADHPALVGVALALEDAAAVFFCRGQRRACETVYKLLGEAVPDRPDEGGGGWEIAGPATRALSAAPRRTMLFMVALLSLTYSDFDDLVSRVSPVAEDGQGRAVQAAAGPRTGETPRMVEHRRRGRRPCCSCGPG